MILPLLALNELLLEFKQAFTSHHVRTRTIFHSYLSSFFLSSVSSLRLSPVIRQILASGSPSFSIARAIWLRPCSMPSQTPSAHILCRHHRKNSLVISTKSACHQALSYLISQSKMLSNCHQHPTPHTCYV